MTPEEAVQASLEISPGPLRLAGKWPDGRIHVVDADDLFVADFACETDAAAYVALRNAAEAAE